MTGIIREVPEYVVAELAPRCRDYCLCVFVINEGARIRAQLEKMTPLAETLDLIIADGGSTDGSLDEAILRSRGIRTLLTKRGPGKLSAQMRMAIDYALAQGYQGMVTIDGNDKDNPAAASRIAQLLREGCDHVQGSRFIPGGRHENTPLSRLLAVRLIHAPLISVAARFRYTDTTNGFRGYSRRFLEDPRVLPLRAVFERYELHYYLAIRAARLGYRCIETPVERIYPAAGKTPTKISPLWGNLLVLRTLVAACLGRYNPSA